MRELCANIGRVPLRAALYAVVSFSVFVLLIQRFGAPWVLGGTVALGALVALFIWPEIAVLLIVAVLYSNLAALAVQLHGFPAPAAAAVALLLGIPLARYLVLRRERPRIDRTFLLMLVFLLLMLVSSFFAKDLSIAAGHIGTYVSEGVALYLLIINVVRNLTALKRVIWTALLVAGVLGALTLYQGVSRSYGEQFGGLAQRKLRFELQDAQMISAKGPGAGSQGDPEMRLADRACGPVGDPNIYAQILLILLPLAAFRIRDERSRLLRFGAAAVAGLILFAILLTYSRGAFLSLALLFVLAAYLRYIRPRWVLLALVLVAALIPFLAPGYVLRMKSILGATGLVSKTATVQPDLATRRRATEMTAALHVFLDYPLFGVGPGQYVPFYSLDYHARGEPARYQITVPRPAHSLYFQLAAETGALGLGIFVAIVLSVLYRLFQARRQCAQRHRELSNLAVALALGILGYLGTGMFLHLSFERYFWFLLALAGATLQIIRAEARSEGAVSDERETAGASEFGGLTSTGSLNG